MSLKQLTRNIIFSLLILTGVLLIPASLRVKTNLDSQYPPLGYLPELITVEDKLYSREGCAVPANVDNCDVKPQCYTRAYLDSEPNQPFTQVAPTSTFGFFSTPIYNGPRPVSYRPNVYLSYGSWCFIRYQSVGMG